MGRKERHEQWKAKIAAIENSVYEIVKPVVDRNDPESLLKNSPPDEYDGISRRIAETIVNEGGSRLTIEELCNIITLAFHMDFQSWGSRVHYGYPLYFAMATELISLLPDTSRSFTITV